MWEKGGFVTSRHDGKGMPDDRKLGDVDPMDAVAEQVTADLRDDAILCGIGEPLGVQRGVVLFPDRNGADTSVKIGNRVEVPKTHDGMTCAMSLAYRNLSGHSCVPNEHSILM